MRVLLPAEILVPAVILVMVASPALALDYHLVQWRKTNRCEVVTHLPVFGHHWIELGTYTTQWEAERELKVVREKGRCPPEPVAEAPKKPRHPPKHARRSNDDW